MQSKRRVILPPDSLAKDNQKNKTLNKNTPIVLEVLESHTQKTRLGMAGSCPPVLHLALVSFRMRWAITGGKEPLVLREVLCQVDVELCRDGPHQRQLGPTRHLHILVEAGALC